MSATVTLEAPTELQAAAPLIELERVEKVYRTGKLEYQALRGVDLTIEEGEMVAIVGPSGSGKTTIMNMITGIDRPTAGLVPPGRLHWELRRGQPHDLELTGKGWRHVHH